MKHSYKRYIKTYYRYLIGKGELQAHNNSKVLKDQIKEIVSNLKRMNV